LVAQRFGQAEEELSILARAALAPLQVVGIGLAAIGLSGLFVLAMTLLLGSSSVFGFEPSSTFVGPAAYCRELLDQYASAGTCGLAYQQAVLLDELRARFVPGAVGIVMLGGLWLASRRQPGRRLLLPAGRPAWILIGAGIVVVTSLATGQEPGLGVHLSGT
jgi:hypothetical protein